MKGIYKMARIFGASPDGSMLETALPYEERLKSYEDYVGKKSKERPSSLHKSMLGGAAAGTLAGGLIGSSAGPLGAAGGALGGAVMGAGGGALAQYLDKKEIEKLNKTKKGGRKAVKKLFNKRIVTERNAQNSAANLGQYLGERRREDRMDRRHREQLAAIRSINRR